VGAPPPLPPLFRRPCFDYNLKEHYKLTIHDNYK